MSNVARRLAIELVDALEFTAREVSRGLSAGTKRLATEIDKAATTFAEAESKLARDAGGLHTEDGAGPRPAVPGSVRSPGASTHVDLPSVPAWRRPGEIPTAGPASTLIPPTYDRFGGLSQQEFYDRFYDPVEQNWRYPPDDGFDGGVQLPNTLAEGDTLDRFGDADGFYASDEGLPFDQRSLPPSSLAYPYQRYEVTSKGLPEGVTEGPIAPWFGQPGGGVQYKFDKPIQWYVDHGHLKVVE